MAESEGNRRIRWADSPPRREGTFLPIWTVPPGRKLEGWIVSKYATGVLVHYAEVSPNVYRTQPCYDEHYPCQWCWKGYGKRWQGFIAIQTPSTAQLGLAQFTVEAWRSEPLLQQRKETLRGRWLKLWRLGSKRNAKMIGLVERRDEFIELLPEPSIEKALCRIWQG